MMLTSVLSLILTAALSKATVVYPGDNACVPENTLEVKDTYPIDMELDWNLNLASIGFKPNLMIHYEVACKQTTRVIRDEKKPIRSCRMYNGKGFDAANALTGEVKVPSGTQEHVYIASQPFSVKDKNNRLHKNCVMKCNILSEAKLDCPAHD